MKARRFVLGSSMLVGPMLAAFVACGGEELAPPPPPSNDASSDAPLFVEATSPPPPPPTDPPPGNVCGDRSGLFFASPWPLRGGCPTRAGWSAVGGPQTAATWWTLSVPAADSSPAVESGGGVVWIGTSDGWLMAVQNGGIVRSALYTGHPVQSSPALDADGNAVFAGGDGILYGVHVGGFDVPDVGSDAGPSYPPAIVRFSLPLGPMASSPVIGADGTIYVGTLDGKLFAVSPHGASTKWSVTTNDTAGSSPAIGQDGTVYVGSTDHGLYAIKPDGTMAWRVDLGAEVTGSPAVGGDGTIYVGSVDGKLHAVEAAGKIRWAYATGGPITGTPAVYAGVVYVGSADKKLHAVSVIDGTERWTYETQGAVATPVIASDGTVYVGSADARVYAIKAKGTLLFAVNVKGRVKSAPAIVQGPTLYVTTDTALVAVGP
jgi:outer membrane protein assembly factor BamB